VQHVGAECRSTREPASPYTPYRFALYRFDWSTISSQTIENDLGSANMGLAVASSGDVFVAGSLALNATGARVLVPDRVSMPTDVALLESSGVVQRAWRRTKPTASSCSTPTARRSPRGRVRRSRSPHRQAEDTRWQARAASR